MVESEYMTIRETAIYLNRPVSSIYLLVKSKNFPAVCVGRIWKVSKKRLEAWVEKRLEWKAYGIV